jgi:predicted nucleic acid-binding protein
LNYLLDTCVISELVKVTPDGNVINWINNTPDERLFLSVITIGEIRKGLTKLPDSKKKYQLTNWLNSFYMKHQ